MGRREFLGWDEPLLGLLVDWLWARRGELPWLTVVVPTRQSGRRLREALAERGPVLSARVVTPGWLLECDHAAPAAEMVAWMEVLEGVRDWQAYEELFPQAPGLGEEAGWSLALAKSFMATEDELAGAAMTLEEVGWRMGSSVEAGRWRALSALWRRKEERLRAWGLRSRAEAVRGLVETPVAGRLVLAGTPDLPEAAVRRLSGAEWVSLVAAPAAEAENFDEYGRVLAAAWTARALAWPEDAVRLAAGPHEQAVEAVRWVAKHSLEAEAVALGSGDEEVAGELERVFGEAGWRVHNPAGLGMVPAAMWLRLWREWLREPVTARAIDLLGLRETEGLSGGARMLRVQRLSRLRDGCLVRSVEDVRRADEQLPPEDRERGQSGLGVETMERLLRARSEFLSTARRSPGEALEALIARVDRDGEWESAREWITRMEPVLRRSDRPAGLWLDLLARDLEVAHRDVPEERVGDVVGWLELLHEPGENMVVAGMNEGRVPAMASMDGWLNEGVRDLLGLANEQQRAGRDAYLFTALQAARAGKIAFFLGKSTRDGSSLQPSRLLLAASGKELARRVNLLFDAAKPMDAGVSWKLSEDWKWRAPVAETISRIPATALSDYLACPYRFYLKHVLSMSRPEPERWEWNARDFGNLMHNALEAWGNDEEGRSLTAAEEIYEWLLEKLAQYVAADYGERLSMATRIQWAQMRARIKWFSKVQAQLISEGWRVYEVEKKYPIELGDGVTLVAKIDRVDRHEGTGQLRILDYKTGEWHEVFSKHLKLLNATSKIPEHLREVDAARWVDGKSEYLWQNLQVPMYAWALGGRVADLGYFYIGRTEPQVGLSLWDGFHEAHLESAQRCARWVAEQIRAAIFWPPSEKVEYDDYAELCMQRLMVEVCCNG